MGYVVGLDKVEELSGDQRFAAYACLDATGTREIWDKLRGQVTERQEKVYRWTMAQLGPAIVMGRRGIRVDLDARDRAIKDLVERHNRAVRQVRELLLVREAWDGTQLETGTCAGAKKEGGRHLWSKHPDGPERYCTRCNAPRVVEAPFEPGSNEQVAHLLYDLLGVEAPGGKSGERAVDEDSLGRVRRYVSGLKTKHQGVAELVDLVLEVRDCVKQVGTLKMPLTPAGRFHATFKPFGTWTGRFSSRRDPFEIGQNAQNISEQHRHIFVADAGRRMAYVDLKTAESLVCGYLAGDTDYIEAHKGDVHTRMTRLLWPKELPWTGDDKKDKAIAKGTNPEWDQTPGHDYRFQAKRIVHGSTYGQSPYGIARLMHIPVRVAQDAQRAFFFAFPRLREWQRYIYARVVEGLPIVTPFFREVTLLGRPWDEHTYKQGLALTPQSAVGDILNTALFRVYSKYDPDLLELLAQIHDAILLQWREEKEEEALKALDECMTVSTPITDIYGTTRVCTIGHEVAVGWNWGKQSPDNPRGLVEL